MGLMDEVVIKSPEEMKADLEGKGPSAEQEASKNQDPRLSEKYTFPIKWCDPRGKVWKGDFTNEILTFTKISQVGALKARLAGGMPAESLDDYTYDHNEKVAHLTISLVDRPKWAVDLGELRHKHLLDLIYKEVSQHEAIFSGRITPEEIGARGVEDAEGGAERVVESEV